MFMSENDSLYFVKLFPAFFAKNRCIYRKVY